MPSRALRRTLPHSPLATPLSRVTGSRPARVTDDLADIVAATGSMPFVVDFAFVAIIFDVSPNDFDI